MITSLQELRPDDLRARVQARPLVLIPIRRGGAQPCAPTARNYTRFEIPPAPSWVDMAQAPETIELTIPGIPAYLHRRFPRRASAGYGR